MPVREGNGGPTAHPGAAPVGRVRAVRHRLRRHRLQRPPRALNRGQRRHRRRVRKRLERSHRDRVNPAAGVSYNGGERRAQPSVPSPLQRPPRHHPHRRAAVSSSVGASRDRNGKRSHSRGMSRSPVRLSDSHAEQFHATSRVNLRLPRRRCNHCLGQFRECRRRFNRCRKRCNRCCRQSSRVEEVRSNGRRRLRVASGSRSHVSAIQTRRIRDRRLVSRYRAVPPIRRSGPDQTVETVEQ